MSVRQVSEYGTDRGPTYYSAIISSAWVLPTTGNLLVQPGVAGGVPFGAPGSKAIVTEVAADGSLVFEAVVKFRNCKAVSPPGWGGFDISCRAHRIEF